MWVQVIIIVLCIASIGYIYKKWRDIHKKNAAPKAEALSKDELKENQALQQTNTNLIKVVIWRPLGDGGVVAQVGDPIMAEEKSDENNNVVVINSEKRFKEDFNFSQDRVFETLNYNLKTQNKTKKEKAAILDKAIKTQEELVDSLSTDMELNKDYNANDVEHKLRQLRVLREALQMESKGNYMRLAKGGVRQYDLVAVDGVLYPYFFGSRWYRAYPDLTIKKKIFNQENTIFRNEISNLQKGILNWVTVITLLIGVVMIAIGIGAIIWAMGDHAELTTNANKGAITCTNTLANIQTAYGGMVTEYLEIKGEELELLKLNEKNIKSGIPNSVGTIGNIIIDPSKIGR